MNAVKKRRKLFALFFVIGVLLTIWISVNLKCKLFIISILINVMLLVLLLLENRRLYNALLISDNQIFSVPTAVVTNSHGLRKTQHEETIISTFGILIGTKVYHWGCKGLRGVRLKEMIIDRNKMNITFGDDVKRNRIEFFHGMSEYQEVLEVKEKLWHETGVVANISGWKEIIISQEKGVVT